MRKWIALVATAVAALSVVLAVEAGRRGWLSFLDDAPEMQPQAVDTVVTDLEAPWDLAFLPDGSALVTERDSARVLLVSDGAAREVARIPEARPYGEAGLLGIAVSATYATDRWVYVYFTGSDDNRVARLRLDDPARVTPIFVGIPKAENHNGGRIAFGPDGMLYVATGDAQDRSASQDLSNLAGKILRLTPDGAPAPGNPFGASPVYSYGHRNVQGIAWDSSGTMYASEFGQRTYDELNLVTPGGNYGWPEAEGDSGGRFIDPIATWAPREASPSGIAIDASNRVWIACLRGKRLYQMDTDGSETRVVLQGEHGRLRHVANAPDGSMWVLTSNRDGRGEPVTGDDRILRVRT